MTKNPYLHGIATVSHDNPERTVTIYKGASLGPTEANIGLMTAEGFEYEIKNSKHQIGAYALSCTIEGPTVYIELLFHHSADLQREDRAIKLLDELRWKASAYYTLTLLINGKKVYSV